MSLQSKGAKVYDRPPEADRPQIVKSGPMLILIAIVAIIAAIFIYSRYISPAQSNNASTEKTTSQYRGVLETKSLRFA
jgi:hypothetical protein